LGREYEEMVLNKEKWEGTREVQGYRKSETPKGNVRIVVPESNTRWANTRAREEKGRRLGDRR
jgi:hypothetical protein